MGGFDGSLSPRLCLYIVPIHSTVTNIQTSLQAAEALRPIPGNFTFALFALGNVETGLLAVSVLAGSAAYAVSEVFGWTEGLNRRPREARVMGRLILPRPMIVGGRRPTLVTALVTVGFFVI